MEEPVKPEECDIEMVAVPKKKTLKQARLSFQMLSSADSPNVNKKRKLASPTLIECKSPKLLKTTNKLNSFESTKSNVTEIIDLEANDDKAGEKLNEKEANETVNIESSDIKTTPKSKKTDEKSAVKLGSLTRFLTKTESKDSPKNKSESLKENVKPKLTSNDEIPEKVDETKKSNEIDITSENTKISPTETTKVDIDNTEESDEEIDQEQDMDVSKYESDTESSDDDQMTDNKTDVDESEEKRKNSDGIKTPRTKRDIDMKQKKMTPKQLEKQLEKQKRKDDRKKLRLEREKKRDEERENRKRLKDEKKKEKDEKEKAEREQKKKEKEEKELKKQMEIEQKQREKEARKEDQRKREEAKEEEKRKKEEEKLEAERKKQKAVSSFVSFFVTKKPAESKTEQITAKTMNFMPFEVKADMRIAPVCRRTITNEEREKFDENWEKQSLDKSKLYLGEIKNKEVPRRKSGKTWPPKTKEEEDDDDVVILESDDKEENYNVVDRGNVAVEKHRAKLLMFNENRRPPYRGTWRKKSSLITPRKPFTKDVKWFDYEVDSDEEWEEEEPGESLHGSDDEKDEENPDDNEYDVDNEFMVPHGYLSEEEAQAEDDEDMNPETQKFKLKILGEQFEAERNTKTAKLKPKVIGCIWQNSDNTYASNIHSQVLQLLKDREIWTNEIPINLQSSPDNESLNGSECGTPSGRMNSGPGAKKTRVPEEAVPDLIRLVHGNVNGRGFLIKEFMCFWTKKNDLRVSKVSLSKKIREIARWTACPEEGPMHQKNCWFVNEDVRKKYLNSEDCSLPNRWNYILTPKKRIEVAADLQEKIEKDDKEREKEKKSVPLITQFTKKFTQEEMKKQLSEVPATKSTPNVNKKRVALISVGRGEKFPKSPRMSLLNKFMVGDNANNATTTKKMDDDIIILDDDEKKEENTTEQDEKLQNKEETKVESSEKKETKVESSEKKETKVENSEKEESNEKRKNTEAESEDDCIMILDESNEEKDTRKSEETNLDINEKKVSPSKIVNDSEELDQLDHQESKMETSTTE
ncbi:chromatin assembly factor 1 subunit A-B-like [Leptopilina heterotoma]|uniref:chromatin assembly factor 1 subunit A-B-like n=1 Tax=Leptopilina heterotoma TaxID=63436 RepID=UPI001CA9E2E8|nr:chromatin assembly factor 1 subunit A-B-like [Leptopilina heterotoma]